MTQELVDMQMVKVGPSLVERGERLIAAWHHQQVLNRLQRFREALEQGVAPVAWMWLETPQVLLLADVCDALGLDELEKAEVLGPVAQNALAEVLETRVVPHSDRPLNARQAQALKVVRKHGAITQSAYRQLYPDLSGETLRLDLADLVGRGLLRKHGNCRGTYYTLAG